MAEWIESGHRAIIRAARMRTTIGHSGHVAAVFNTVEYGGTGPDRQ
jgi:hypothetical protein